MAEQLFQVGVKALVRDQQGRILLEGKDRGNGFVTYDFPGGRVDEGEGLEDALRREVSEEIGVLVEDSPELWATTKTKLTPQVGNDTVGLIIIIYFVKLASKNLVKGLDQHSLCWVSPLEAADKLTFKYDDALCEAIRRLP